MRCQDNLRIGGSRPPNVVRGARRVILGRDQPDFCASGAAVFYNPHLRTYVITSGIFFALIALAHVARVFAEGASVLAQPFFDITSTLAVGLALWAFQVLRR